MARIVVIVGHARTATYCEALGESYARGARTGGHEVKLFVTSRITFDPILHEGFECVQPLEKDLSEAHSRQFSKAFWSVSSNQTSSLHRKSKGFLSCLKASPHGSLLRWECLA